MGYHEDDIILKEAGQTSGHHEHESSEDGTHCFMENYFIYIGCWVPHVGVYFLTYLYEAVYGTLESTVNTNEKKYYGYAWDCTARGLAISYQEALTWTFIIIVSFIIASFILGNHPRQNSSHVIHTFSPSQY